MALTLNGFRVDPVLESLMSRSDWPGKRTHENWLKRFPCHPESSGIRIVEFCSPDRAKQENRGIQHHRFLGLFGLGRRDDQYLNGKANSETPPGDFDPWHGYLIGFTDFCDAGIFVDLRPHKPRVIYDTLNPISATQVMYLAYSGTSSGAPQCWQLRESIFITQDPLRTEVYRH